MGKPSLGIQTKIPSNTSSSQDGEDLLLPNIEVGVATDLKTRRRSYRVVVYIFISSIFLLLGLSLVCLYLRVRFLETKVSASEDLPEFCMECSELYASSINNQVIRRVENTLKCCARTPDQYTWLMKKVDTNIASKITAIVALIC
ncbi:hypothetical protein SNE40_001020 [Patella caerulea]|uniref:Uncharacterized protein n=1 Tax=Patella caerulea TaxID=87958 RepID=A0AAN8KDK2_PATCE